MKQSTGPLGYRNIRLDLLASLLLVVITTTYLYKSSTPFFANSISKMVAVNDTSLLDLSFLRVTISADVVKEPKTTVNLTMKIKNTSTSKIVTILKWSSPLDPGAAKQGLVFFQSERTGAIAPSLDIKVNRAFPPKEDDYLEIGSGEEVSSQISISPPVIDLEDGEEYTVIAKGKWLGVWEGPKSDVLRLLDADSMDGATGGWASNEIDVKF